MQEIWNSFHDRETTDRETTDRETTDRETTVRETIFCLVCKSMVKHFNFEFSVPVFMGHRLYSMK